MEHIFTVTELNESIKNVLEESFDTLWVEGEISNLRRPSSGHVYFVLKDDKSQIRAVMFRSSLGGRAFPWSRSTQFDLEDGMMVICRGRLNVYHPRGEYQIIVDAIEPKGVGALQIAFEQLKARLQAEGLFDPCHKKEIPFLPSRIGVITSPSGAVIRDILTITARRFPTVDILVAPVRVQGPEAPGEIVQAIRDLNEVGNIDVIILARGGGSLEDLAPFNDEGVARAVFASRIPVISAVGHEIDYTIVDFVADLRAPTPSAAAELVVPVREELVSHVETLRTRLINQVYRLIEKIRHHVASFKSRLKDPRRVINDFRIYVDERVERLRMGLEFLRRVKKEKIHHIETKLLHLSPLSRIREYRMTVQGLKKELFSAWNECITQFRVRVDKSVSLLDSLSPLAVLRRGYGIVRKLPEGLIVREARVLPVGSSVHVKVSLGSFHGRVTEVLEE